MLLSLNLAIKSLKQNLGRTILTLLGVIISVVVIFVVVSFGNSVKSFVVGQVESFGPDLIQVEVKVPSTTRNSTANASALTQGVQVTTFKKADIDAIEKLPNIDALYAGNIGQALISRDNINKYVQIFGVTPSVVDVDLQTVVSSGMFFDKRHEESASRVVVLGSGVAKLFFGVSDPIGQKIRLKGQSYRVIGVLKERGTVAFFNFDDLIYMPLSTMQDKILGINYITFASVKVVDSGRASITQAEIENLLRKRHNIRTADEDDFSVTTIAEARETVSNVFSSLTILLFALGFISLIVGGVGIMNVMLIGTEERIFEIGLRRAVGARQSDIFFQFLIEAIFLGIMGGIIGIIFGIGLFFLVIYILAHLNFELVFSFSYQTIVLSLGFSVITGLLFGVYPAYKASRISPIAAIRQ